MITFRNIGKLGRFGNSAFQIASTIGIAIRNNYNYAFPIWKNYDHLERFGSSEDIDVYKYFVNQLPFADDLERFPERWVNWGYYPGPFPDNISLNGHLQSDKYFNHCINVVRHYFRMIDEPEQNDYVAIHYRAGDYTEGTHTYHPRQPKEYYEKAMKLFPEGTEFALFSDDIDGFINMMDAKWDWKFSFAKRNYIEDFKLMKRCKSFICANSSYSVFAAILGEHPEKKIICPRLWFGAAAEGLSADDIYPENSIII